MNCRFIIVIFFLIFPVINNAQSYNLVNNGSFEDYLNCPNPPSSGLTGVNFWLGASTNQIYHMNYFNSCILNQCCSVPNNVPGFQYPKSGNGYIGGWFMFAYGGNIRNYAESQLKSILVTNKKYYISFYVNLNNKAKYALNNVGLLLTDTFTRQPSNGTNIIANPQILNFGNPIINDTLNWVKISKIYKALGGEKYITIGNFKTDLETDTTNINVGNISADRYGGYYIDDVSVIPLDSFALKADAGRDTIITIGDSAFIGSYTNGIDSLHWQILSTTTTIDSLRPGFWVKPLVNTCYILTQTVNGFTSSDTVCVNVNPLPLNFLSYELRVVNEHTPKIENIWSTANEINVSHFNIQRNINDKDFTTIGKLSAQNKNYNEYSFIDGPTINNKLETFYYRIESVDIDGKKQYSTTKQITIKHQTTNNIFIYPNPAKDIITIKSTEVINDVMLLDIFGREISRFTRNDGNSFQFFLNIQPYSKGYYILKVISNKGNVSTEKLIVQ